jgi:tRNA pseudouridine38-40 synthase
MRNIKLTIEYDGTAYHGWQSQANAAAIQDIVGAAINKLTGEECTLHGSGRTDAGVHAYGQAANFRTASGIPADKFAFALNTLLPQDIVIVKSEEVGPDFHARFSARGKRYRYLFYNSVFPSALLRNRAWHIYYPLDAAAMREAAGHLLGTHDFLAFSASGGSVKTTVRTVAGISLQEKQGDGSAVNLQGDGSLVYKSADGPRRLDADTEAGPMPGVIEQQNRPPVFSPRVLSLEIEGNGFLYNMVRIIAGTLAEVGYGRLKPGEIPEILESRDRKRTGVTAPPQGLYLMEVFY